MAPKNEGSTMKVMNKGAWTAEEDKKLAEYIEIHGPKKWKTVALKAGLNRCGKSCRLRWLNYLRPNIKRGNISDAEEDLILRLHKLLGNRWSLIAGRLPGRTDNEIKNYWNSHLIKKATQKDKQIRIPPPQSTPCQKDCDTSSDDTKVVKNNNDDQDDHDDNSNLVINAESDITFDVDEFFDFSTEGTYGLDWINMFLQLDDELILD